MSYESDDDLMATELRLGLPGTDHEPEKQPSRSVRSNKRVSSEIDVPSGVKGQVVGWPPVRTCRKNFFQPKKTDQIDASGTYVKVSMDGAPYLRKIDLRVYKSYSDLLKELENMFKCVIGVYSEREGYNGSDYAPTYEDKDGDWMMVGDVPWEMFATCCRRLRIMKGSDAKGLGWP
ncbi:Auxin-induced protein 22D [Sarracenia purpurea var. burkii]